VKKTLIIAEIGVNHNGSFVKAKKLIDAANKSGADIIKFQFFRAKNIATRNLELTKYQKKNTKYKNQFDMLKKLELSEKKIINLTQYCKKNNIKVCISFFSHEDLDVIKKCKIDFLKIPSGELNNTYLINKLSNFKKKMIISTGMSNISEISKTVKILKNKVKNKDIYLLQCTSAYPAPFKDLNLKTIETLKKKFNLKIGFSDHSLGIEASIAAVSIGAEMIEKHFTMNKRDVGPDHKASLDPKEFEKMVIAIRNIEQSLGKIKILTSSEKQNYNLVRKKIVAKTKIKKGDLLSIDKISIKRTNDINGMSADKINLILNKISKKNYEKDETI
tara:strand:+ start:409 stop:1404 length:996 start_codon:yes stop_codon:yes gene_type:complete